MAPENPVVRVGVAAVIKNADGKLVMGIRKGVFSGKKSLLTRMTLLGDL